MFMISQTILLKLSKNTLKKKDKNILKCQLLVQETIMIVYLICDNHHYEKLD